MDCLTDCEVRLRQMIGELRENARIRVYTDEPGQLASEFGAAQSVFQIILEKYGIPLDPSLQHCFMRFDEFSSHWRFEESNIILTGEFRLSYLLAALAIPPPPLSSKNSSEFERQLYTEFRVIDDKPGGGSGNLAALRLLPGVSMPEIWYHDRQRGTFKLDINYCEYLEALILTKGVSGWQYLFANASLANDDFIGIASTIKDMLAVFPELFPGYEYEPLQSRFAERLR